MAFIKNLTPHPLVFETKDGKLTIPPCGDVARISVNISKIGEIDGIPLVETYHKEIVNLPEPEPGVVYVVSQLVAQRTNRDDVFAPDTSIDSAIRDPEGRIIAVRRLSKNAKVHP